MKVLVTGATGFVGSAVVRALLRHGHGVVGLVRDRRRAEPLANIGVTIHEGDMARPETYEPLVAGVDAVIHAAQDRPRGRWSHKKIAHMHRTDALMTRTLAKACLTHKKLFIYTSGAMSHMGNGGEWIDERTPMRACLMAKGHADMVIELKEQHRRDGLRLIVITPGFVYGAGGFLQETVELLARRQYRVIGDGANYWSFVNADDLGEVYALALDRGSSGANYFVSDDQPMTRREAIDLITDGLGIPRVKNVPNFIVGLWLGFPLVEAINASIRMRNDFVKTALGWSPRYRSFAEGLRPALEELRRVGSGGTP